jgi:plasmid stabilization system protein ParE
MSVRVDLSPRARVEVMEATAWYLEEGGIEVGLRFALEVDKTVDRIAAAPHAWTEHSPGMRRALVRGFPYSILFVIEGERVEILAVMHQRRHPDSWKR